MTAARRRADRGMGDRGSMSILAAFLCALTLVVGAAVIVVAGAHVAAERARTAADLGALSAARMLRLGGDACAEAHRVAETNGSVVTSCRIDGQDTIVRIEHSAGPPIYGAMTARATARAGP